MRIKLICCTLAAAMLLCACQVGKESQNVIEDTPAPALEQSEQEKPSSDHGIEKEEPEEDAWFPMFPPAPPVCEPGFTETESFPFPFKDELRIDYLHYPPRLFLTTEQALYDYDTMWQLLDKNYPYFEAIKRELRIDWEEVKAEYRQILEGHASHGHIWQPYFVQTIDECLREFQSVGHLFLVTVGSRLGMLDLWKNIEFAPYQNIFKILNNPKSELFYKYYERQLPYQGSGGSNSDPKKGEPVSIEGLTAITEQLFTGYTEGSVPYLENYILPPVG